MYVVNHAPQFRHIGAPYREAVGADGQKMFQHGDPDMAIDLMPGVNTVNPVAWAEAKKLRTIQALLESEVLEERDSEPLENLDEKAAAALIKETFTMATLQSWDSEEKRANVKKALKAQIKKMEVKKAE